MQTTPIKKTLLFFLTVFLLFSLASPVFASPGNVSIQMSDINAFNPNLKIDVFSGTGAFIGEFNSTDLIELNNTTDYVFMFKPSPSSWFNDPLNALNLLKAGMPTMFSYLLFGVVVFAFLVVLIAIVRRR